MIEQLVLDGLTVSSITRGEMERAVIQAAQFCESAAWMAWRTRYDDGLARRGLRRRRSRARRNASAWSDEAFKTAGVYFHGR